MFGKPIEWSELFRMRSARTEQVERSLGRKALSGEALGSFCERLHTLISPDKRMHPLGPNESSLWEASKKNEHLGRNAPFGKDCTFRDDFRKECPYWEAVRKQGTFQKAFRKLCSLCEVIVEKCAICLPSWKECIFYEVLREESRLFVSSGAKCAVWKLPFEKALGVIHS